MMREKDNRFWLIPSLLLLQSLFVGTTFSSSAITILLYLLAVTISIAARRRANLANGANRNAGNGVSTSSVSSNRAPAKKPKGSLRRTFVIVTIFLFFIATAAWRLTLHLGDTINPLAYGVDSMAHAALIIGLLLHAFYPRFGHPSMLGLGLLVVMLCVAAGGSSQSLAGQVSVALLSIVGFLFSSRLILNHWVHGKQFESAKQPANLVGSNTADKGRTNLLFSALTLSVILMTTSAVAHVTSIVLPDLQGLVHYQLKSSLDAVTHNTMVSSSKYVRGDRIGSIGRHMTNEPADIALRAYSSTPPGYLRGSAFDYYDNGRWSSLENDDLPPERKIPSVEPTWLKSLGDGLTAVQGRSNRRLKRFELHASDSSKSATVEIHNQPLKGPIYFVPLNTRWIECNARRLRFSFQDILEYGPDRSNPYILGIDENPVVDPLDAKRRDVLTRVPTRVKAKVAEVGKEICGKHFTARNKAMALQNYFQNEYEYSLQRIPLSRGADPIVQFLDLKHPAHCEFFASATALILRSEGVPTRYVTGYDASEFSIEEDAWVARNRDAHAWVEAYDNATQTWFPVESTTGRVYRSLLSDGNNSLLDNAAEDENKLADDREEGLVGRVLGWIMSMRATDPLNIAFRLAQWPLFLLLAYLLWKRFVRGDGSELNPDDVKSKLMLAKVDRLVRKHQLVRFPHETMHQFAIRVEDHANQMSEQSAASQNGPDQGLQDKLQTYANWYRQFAESRYQGQMPKTLA